MFGGYGGTAPKPVGTPEMVVDVWRCGGGSVGFDGFNIVCEFFSHLIHYLNLVFGCCVKEWRRGTRG